jgi:hypothetical protein
MSEIVIYRANGAIHPDHPGRLGEILLAGGELATKYNKLWGVAATLAKTVGWKGHCRVGPFLHDDGLVWDEGDNTVWLAFHKPNDAIESGTGAWVPVQRTVMSTQSFE